MCGINGFNFKDKELIEKMNVLTRHRGPDDTGVEVFDNASLGNNRLAVIDITSAGHQPMYNKQKSLCIVYNGEMFNFKEIRAELLSKGYKFESESDTEVVLSAYEEWGNECLQKFNGMFAFAILHVGHGKLFIARDRLGVNPFYYYFKGNKFIFSSEIKAILAHKIERELDIDSLNFYFRLLYIPSPKTIWKNIYKLPPAHYAVLENGRLEISRYWELKDFEDLKDKEEIKHKIKTLVQDAVRSQLISDRPVGLFLSGGIDSTAVCGIMSKFAHSVETFSIGFEPTEEAKKYNRDFDLARQTAKFFGTKHHEFIISALDVKNNFERAVYHMDEPISNHIQTVNFLLAKETVKYVTVVLGGDGGDEVWGGYSRYYYDKLITRTQKLPKFLRKLFFRNEKFGLPQGVDRYLSFWSTKEELVASFLSPDLNNTRVVRDFFLQKYFWHIIKDSTKQMMLVDLLTWLADESLVRSNKMSMAHGLEQRVPLLDHHLVELGFKVPTKYKISKFGYGKDIFIDALAEYLPPHVLGKTKWGWFSPAAKWLRGDLKNFAKEILSPSYCSETRDFFDFNAIERMFDAHVEKKQYNLNAIWALMTFQVWRRGSAGF